MKQSRKNISGEREAFTTVLLFLFVSFSLLSTSCTSFNRRVVNGNAAPSPTASPSGERTSRLPTPIGFVNDFANVIDSESEARLEALLTKLKDIAKIEFAVVTIDTTAGEPLFDFSLAVAREWGIGPRTSDGGGLLLMVAIEDRAWRLQVSRSLEQDLPDEVSKQLGDQSELLYQQGNYAAGIEKYVVALIERLEMKRNFSITQER